jgi:hypothetical protein
MIRLHQFPPVFGRNVSPFTLRHSQLYISVIGRDCRSAGADFTSAQQASGVEAISAWLGATPGRMIPPAQPDRTTAAPRLVIAERLAQQSGCTKFQGGET